MVTRRLVEQAKQSQLRKGMTYDEVVKVMGREPTHQGESITYGNGAVGTFYYWSEEGADTFSTDFVDGRLSQFGMTWVESPRLPTTPEAKLSASMYDWHWNVTSTRSSGRA